MVVAIRKTHCFPFARLRCEGGVLTIFVQPVTEESTMTRCVALNKSLIMTSEASVHGLMQMISYTDWRRQNFHMIAKKVLISLTQ